MSKSVPQLTARSTVADTDLFHIVSSNVDYKITGADLKLAINPIDTAVIYKKKVTLLNADILTSFATPIECIPAAEAGVGFAINVLAIAEKSTFGVYDVAYATNTNLDIKTEGSGAVYETLATSYSASFYKRISLGDAGLIENTAVVAQTKDGNPTAGTTDIDLYFLYTIDEI